jgi:CheY-like chemotaxis protein
MNGAGSIGPGDGTLAGLRVLVVEDEMIVAMMVEALLADLGCAVVATASRVRKALDVAARGDIDLAVLDVNIAGEPVYPVADRLAGRGVPFAFATGYGIAGVHETWRNRPIVQKPFRRDQLEHVLKEALARG